MKPTGLAADLLAERFGQPVRTDRPRPAPRAPDITQVIAELDSAPIHLLACSYAGCDRPADGWGDEWPFCPEHLRRHATEVAS